MGGAGDGGQQEAHVENGEQTHKRPVEKGEGSKEQSERTGVHGEGDGSAVQGDGSAVQGDGSVAQGDSSADSSECSARLSVHGQVQAVGGDGSTVHGVGLVVECYRPAAEGKETSQCQDLSALEDGPAAEGGELSAHHKVPASQSEGTSSQGPAEGRELSAHHKVPASQSEGTSSQGPDEGRELSAHHKVPDSHSEGTPSQDAVAQSEGPSDERERSTGDGKAANHCNLAVPQSTGSSQKTPQDGSLGRMRPPGKPPVLARSTPPIPYHEPPWAAVPSASASYHLETLKNGVILSSLHLAGQTWFVFGRLPGCDVSMEHPSVSRYHAVLQYRGAAGSEEQQDRGFYMYDLGSTHGTFVNKKKIPPKTYCRLRVGHVLKLGGSTRLFILQGPEDDQESESELSVTQLIEARQRQRSLQEKMLGDDFDADPPEEEMETAKPESGPSNDGGCSWGMGDDAMEEEGEEVVEEEPIMEFQEEREAYYVKDPKKALQGFLDREGEELECEFDDKGHNSWLCRIRLPVNDAMGNQLIAEATLSGKKKEAMALCALEACRILDMRGLLRQEAVSRKRKTKNWEDEDFYDSDDDTFLDRTGAVEKKRIDRMKKAGRIEEKAETYDTLVSKLNEVKYELAEISEKLKPSRTGQSQSAAQDSLDAFMREIRSGEALDSVTRKKLHLRSSELKKEQQRLEVLVKMVKPTSLPELKPQDAAEKPKKLSLPMFGAMKGGKKFKLKTGAIGNLPPQRTNLPGSLFNMKGGGSDPEEEEEEEDDVDKEEHEGKDIANRFQNSGMELKAKEDLEKRLSPPSGQSSSSKSDEDTAIGTTERDQGVGGETKSQKKADGCHDDSVTQSQHHSPESKKADNKAKELPVKKKKLYGPSRPPSNVLSKRYPEDDPDYCVWTPPAGQSGDGRTHLNEKYGY
ncbi:kanadaptin [Lissotriton helveticus]